MPVPTPLLEIDEALEKALKSDYTYYDSLPEVEFTVPYVAQEEIATDEVRQVSSGLWDVTTFVRLELVVDPSVERATAFAQRVLVTLNAYAWSFDGFGIGRVWASRIDKGKMNGTHGEVLHTVSIDFTWEVTWNC